MNQEYLKVLRCPLCKGDLQQQINGLLCQHDQLLFPIRDGIAIMLIEQAVKINNEE